MNRATCKLAVLAAVLAAAGSQAAFAQQRPDVLWARSTVGAPITLNGILSEPAWAKAESIIVRYGIDSGIPGSGWKAEAGVLPSDATHATLRFLTVNNQLYLGATIRDRSVGGSREFNRFDGLLMAIKDHLDPYRPAPPSEYFYSWWFPELMPPNDTEAGMVPGFRGRWTHCNAPDFDCTLPRTPEMVDAWDAVTVVNGTSNSDGPDDVGYTVEMRFDLTPMGYDVTQPDGDVVEWNGAIYDCDWFWPFQPVFSSNRVWVQGPWGNVGWYHNLRIHARPSVTINTPSYQLPPIGPDLRIRVADNFAAPTINGGLTEPVWQYAPGLDIRFDDTGLRDSYPGMGPYRSGQYQPEVNGDREPTPLFDPGDATVKMFVKGDFLYLGFDVRDKVVQNIGNFDRWDGFLVSINERNTRGNDNQLVGRRLSFQVGPTGQAVAADYLPYLRDTLGGALLGMQLKPGTTVDTVGTQEDAGYTAELRLDLTKLGYPAGLGDRILWLGVNLLDGDSFTPFTDSYSTRTWWQREYEGLDGPVWAYIDPNAQVVVGVDDPPDDARLPLALLGNTPNPFRDNTAVRLSLPDARDVAIEVFDLQGRLVASRAYGRQEPGARTLRFRQERLAAGVYLYRVQATSPATGARDVLHGKMLLVR